MVKQWIWSVALRKVQLMNTKPQKQVTAHHWNIFTTLLRVFWFILGKYFFKGGGNMKGHLFYITSAFIAHAWRCL